MSLLVSKPSIKNRNQVTDMKFGSIYNSTLVNDFNQLQEATLTYFCIFTLVLVRRWAKLVVRSHTGSSHN